MTRESIQPRSYHTLCSPKRAAHIFKGLLPANNDSASFARLIVNTECRGKGHGKMRVRLLIETAHASTFTRASLFVDNANAAAIALYRKHGFTEVPATAVGPESPRSLYMELTL
jgi:ribosomal protein S18 acetylase RimI-like enzyme